MIYDAYISKRRPHRDGIATGYGWVSSELQVVTPVGLESRQPVAKTGTLSLEHAVDGRISEPHQYLRVGTMGVGKETCNTSENNGYLSKVYFT